MTITGRSPCDTVRMLWGITDVDLRIEVPGAVRPETLQHVAQSDGRLYIKVLCA